MNDNESQQDKSSQGEDEVQYELKSAKEAAQFLRVSESTVWRWVAQDIVPAYRVGRKRIRFRRSDLQALINPARRKKDSMTAKDRMQLIAMTGGASVAGAGAVEEARKVQAEILARRGGEVLAASWQDIDEAREERSADL